MSKTQSYRLVLIAAAAVVLYGIFRPEPIDFGLRNLDKLAHVLAFTGISLLARIAYPQLKTLLIWPLLIACALISEALQAQLLPQRVFSYYDMLANSLGVALAATLLLASNKLQQRQARAKIRATLDISG